MVRRSNQLKTLLFIGVFCIFILVYVTIWEPYCFFARAVSSSDIGDLAKVRLISPKPIPSSSSTRDIIVVLTSRISSKFVARLQQLDMNFQDDHATPLLILYTSEPYERDLNRLAELIERPIVFLNVDEAFHLFPPGFDPCRAHSPYRRRGKWNYSSMIRFWFKLIFELPQLQDYDYIMRLDDDSQLTDKWPNIFQEMRKKNAVYFANDADVDLEDQLPGTMQLKRVVVEYLEHNQVEPKQPEVLKNAFGDGTVRTYFNNFEVTKKEFFQRENIRQWVESVDGTYGIFKYRWGDAILRYLTLAIFATKEEILHRSDYNLSYCHKC